jgi:predicted YcjX-like family ATPase
VHDKKPIKASRRVLAFMSIISDDLPLDLVSTDDSHDARRVAYGYVEDAFAEAQQDGLDSDALAHAALFAAFRTLVETYGEEATAIFAEGLADKVRTGAFSSGTRH